MQVYVQDVLNKQPGVLRYIFEYYALGEALPDDITRPVTASCMVVGVGQNTLHSIAELAWYGPLGYGVRKKAYVSLEALAEAERWVDVCWMTCVCSSTSHNIFTAMQNHFIGWIIVKRTDCGTVCIQLFLVKNERNALHVRTRTHNIIPRLRSDHRRSGLFPFP